MNKKAQKKMRMPSGQGGIVRYFDDYKSKFEIKPEHVIFLTVILILTVLILGWFAGPA